MFLYIDPGTGSMLFTVLISVIGAAIYSLRMLLVKLRTKVGGKKRSGTDGRIPFVIFSDDKRYYSVFEPILRILDERGCEVLYLTGSEDDPVLSASYAHVKAEYLSGNRLFARLNFLSADVLLSTTPGLDVYQCKRSKQVRCYVHLPHAASEIVLYRMFGIDYYDAILLSGEYQKKDVRDLEALRSLPAKELTLVGIPYMDEMKKRLDSAPPVPAHERTVLLAPSWGKSAIFSVYGGKIIDALLATDMRVVIRPHPQSFKSESELMERLMREYPASERLEWNRDTDNFDVLRRSDILISDFSGVIFDFALVYDKPVIYTAPNFDVGQYDAWWLSRPLWTLSALPRLGCELTEESMPRIAELIEDCLADKSYAEGRKSVRRETWAHMGKGAVRCADYLIAKQKELTKEDT